MRIILFVLTALASSMIVFGGTVLRGTITDSSGSAIPGAIILVHWDPAGSTVGLESNVGIKSDVIIRSDDKGRFVAELPPGFYDVFVSAMAFTPTCRKVRIRRTAGPDFTFQMEVDPLVTQELGSEVIAQPGADNNKPKKNSPVPVH